MTSEIYPLAMPNDLLDEVRDTAKAAGLSMADAMRQSLKLGLPKLREQLSTAHLREVGAWPGYVGAGSSAGRLAGSLRRSPFPHGPGFGPDRR